MGQTISSENLKNNQKMLKYQENQQQTLSSDDFLVQGRALVVKANKIIENIQTSRSKTYQALGIQNTYIYSINSKMWSIDEDFNLFKLQLQSLDLQLPLDNIEYISQYTFEISMIKISTVHLLCQINLLCDHIDNYIKKNKPQKNIKSSLNNCLKLEQLIEQGLICINHADEFVKCLHSASLKKQFKKINDDSIEQRIEQERQDFCNEMSFLSTNESFDQSYLEQII